MKVDRKEQRPDALSDGKMDCVADYRMDDPSLHYRTVSKWGNQDGRLARHKTKGYKVVAEDEQRYIVACDKEKYEQRQAEARAKSERRLLGQKAEMSDMPGVRVSQEHDTMQFVKGDD